MDNQQPRFLDTGRKVLDLTGLRVNKLVVKRYIKRGKAYVWECLCNCGTLAYARSHQLQKGSRYGCIKCTASYVQTQRNGGPNKGIKARLYREYERQAKKRNYTFELTYDQFLELINKNCFYCGSKPSLYHQDSPYLCREDKEFYRNGIDRFDNTKGYTTDNAVPCCKMCNYAKNSFTYEEFYNHTVKLYTNLVSKNKVQRLSRDGSTPQANGGGNGNLPDMEDDIV